MDKESYRQGVKAGMAAAVTVVEQLATSLAATDAKAARWTFDIAAYLKQAQVEDMPVVETN